MHLERDLHALYAILADLPERCLLDCTARSGWPRRGLYFFFEAGELRSDGVSARVVRVGTHAVATGSGATLWSRLRQHRGTGPAGSVGGGAHRGSIFRRHVGEALMRSGRLPPLASWGVGGTAGPDVRRAEAEHERAVSTYVGRMPFVWLAVDDEPGPTSERAVIERDVIALLASAARGGIVRPSEGWLGRWSSRDEIRCSGLWNVEHVSRPYDSGSGLPSRLAHAVERTLRSTSR